MKTTNNNHADKLFCIIGQFFKKQRIQRDDKLFAVSSTLKLSHPVISKIENGTYKCLSLKIILKLLEYYGININTFLKYLIIQLKTGPTDSCEDAQDNEELLNDISDLYLKVQKMQSRAQIFK